jgi:hypothetical protein
MSSSKEISRRGFIQLCAIGVPAGYYATKNLNFEYPNSISSENGKDIESRIAADRVPVIEYHYPGYKDGGVELRQICFRQNGLSELKQSKTCRYGTKISFKKRISPVQTRQY